jgi:hypothetical protein
LRLEDLPPPGTKRWVIRRKAEVVAGVRAALISLKKPVPLHAFGRGVPVLAAVDRPPWHAGLRTTRLQDYRAAARRSGSHAHRRIGGAVPRMACETSPPGTFSQL